MKAVKALRATLSMMRIDLGKPTSGLYRAQMPDIRAKTAEAGLMRNAIQARLWAIESFVTQLEEQVQGTIAMEKTATEAVQGAALWTAMNDGLRRFAQLPVHEVLGEFGELSYHTLGLNGQRWANQIAAQLAVLIATSLASKQTTPWASQRAPHVPDPPKQDPPKPKDKKKKQDLTKDEVALAKQMIASGPTATPSEAEQALIERVLGKPVQPSTDSRRVAWIKYLESVGKYVVYNPLLPEHRHEKGKGKGGGSWGGWNDWSGWGWYKGKGKGK